MALRGLTADVGTFDGDGFEEESFLAGLDMNPAANTVAICWHSIRTLQAQFFAGRYEKAYAASLRARKLLWTSPGVHGDPGVPPLHRPHRGGPL